MESHCLRHNEPKMGTVALISTTLSVVRCLSVVWVRCVRFGDSLICGTRKRLVVALASKISSRSRRWNLPKTFRREVPTGGRGKAERYEVK